MSKASSSQEKQKTVAEDMRTPAQIAYDKIQEKRVSFQLINMRNIA